MDRLHGGEPADRAHEALAAVHAPEAQSRRPISRAISGAWLVRDAVGPECLLSLDANQAWEVEQAIIAIERLAEVDPWWIESQRAPTTSLGIKRIRNSVAPVWIATGEHVQKPRRFQAVAAARSD